LQCDIEGVEDGILGGAIMLVMLVRQGWVGGIAGTGTVGSATVNGAAIVGTAGAARGR
jgi:hypothetical protein